MSAPLAATAITSVGQGDYDGTFQNGETEDYAIQPSAPTAITGINGGANAGNATLIVLIMAGVLAVLFITGAGLFVRARRQ